MNLRKYKTSPELLLEQGKAIMSATAEAKFHFRVFAVNMVLAGCSPSLVSSMAGVTKAAVSGWVKSVDEHGFDALRTKYIPGRPRKLTVYQLQEIDRVLQSDAKERGYKVWDGPSLSNYIKNTYDIELSIRQCQRLFHQLGYSLIRPQVYPSKDNENTEQRNEFKKKTSNRE